MATTHNTSYLGTLSMPADRPDAKAMIDVDHVTMAFNIASEQLNSLKEYAIALSRRELRFKEFRALDDVSFQVKQGDVFGILGTNGSGKSTILKIIAGVLEPTRGTCKVTGSIAPLIELGAGFDLELTARENIFLNGALLGYSKKFIQQHFEEIVDFAEVRDFLDMPMKNYSSGMVARIAFAIATVIVPDVLIVDEVLSVGDFMFQQKCERRIQSLIKDHGVTVLIVSHNNDQIERLCNKAAWIEKGHLRCIGDAREVCELYRAIGGRKGSPESEKKILDLLNLRISTDRKHTESVYGDNRYSTSIQINDYIDTPNHTAILTNSEDEVGSRIALSLAGALDAFVLATQGDKVPDICIQELKHRSPSSIILMGSKEFISDNVLSDLALAVPDAKIERLQNDDSGSLPYHAYEFACAHGAQWSDNVIIASLSHSEIGLIALSSYVFSHKVPILYLDEDNRLSQQEEKIAKNSKLLIALADRHLLPEEEIKRIAPEAVSTRFEEDDFRLLGRSINSWLDTQSPETEGRPIRFVVTSPESHIDNHYVGPLAGRLSARILFEDPNDLDSIVFAVESIKSYTSEIDSIVYLGDPLRFSNLNKELMAKAIQSKANGTFV